MQTCERRGWRGATTWRGNSARLALASTNSLRAAASGSARGRSVTNFMRQLYEYAVVVVEVRQEERVRPAVVGPRTANVGADVEPGPTEHGRRRWRGALTAISAAPAVIVPSARSATLAIKVLFIASLLKSSITRAMVNRGAHTT